jgi:hypothetical protein
LPLSAIEQVRLNVGDRGTPPILSDAEVQHFLDKNGGNVDAASGDAAIALAFYFATLADQTTGRMSISYSSRANTYRELAVQFGADGEVAPAFAGGISRSKVQADRDDQDLVQPQFTRDLHDDPQTERSDAQDRRLFP